MSICFFVPPPPSPRLWQKEHLQFKYSNRSFAIESRHVIGSYIIYFNLPTLDLKPLRGGWGGEDGGFELFKS